MTNAAASKPLPPGRTGLPLLGETLPFLKNGFGFIAERTAAHGPIFRTHLLGRPTAVLVGPAGSGQFIDGGAVQREDAMPPHIRELFGGDSLPLLDGSRHLARKTAILAGLTREAVATYVPIMQRRVDEALARWAGQGTIAWIVELKRLSIEIICEAVAGIPPGPLTAELLAQYERVLNAFPHLPVPLPGTAYSKGKAALARVLASFAEVIREHQEEPRGDGLSRILAAKGPGGQSISRAECGIEMHHIIVAGYIVFAELAAIVLELSRQPEVEARLRRELDGLPAGPPAFDRLLGCAYLQQVVLETKRLCPIAPVFFGKARRSFEFAGHTVPAGWMVLWAHRASHLTADIYPDPERFDPDRFSPARAEHLRHEHAFVPQGAGPAHGHRCPGIDFATALMSVYTVSLLREYVWELEPAQDLGYDWGKIPPEPRDGMRARLSRRDCAERSEPPLDAGVEPA
jgi:cytochrome P450